MLKPDSLPLSGPSCLAPCKCVASMHLHKHVHKPRAYVLVTHNGAFMLPFAFIALVGLVVEVQGPYVTLQPLFTVVECLLLQDGVSSTISPEGYSLPVYIETSITEKGQRGVSLLTVSDPICPWTLVSNCIIFLWHIHCIPSLIPFDC